MRENEILIKRKKRILFPYVIFKAFFCELADIGNFVNRSLVYQQIDIYIYNSSHGIIVHPPLKISRDNVVSMIKLGFTGVRPTIRANSFSSLEKSLLSRA